MDNNTFRKKRNKESCEVFQRPNGQVCMKLPGKLAGNRWVYRDNPWNGIGEKEYRVKLSIWDNATPWEHTA